MIKALCTLMFITLLFCSGCSLNSESVPPAADEIADPPQPELVVEGDDTSSASDLSNEQTEHGGPADELSERDGAQPNRNEIGPEGESTPPNAPPPQESAGPDPTWTVELEAHADENMDESISVALPRIDAGSAVCVGSIELSPSKAYRFNVSCEEGAGLFVGLYATDDITGSAGIGFDQRYGTPNRSISAYIDGDGLDGTYYVYVGSYHDGGTDLQNVVGTLFPIA